MRNILETAERLTEGSVAHVAQFACTTGAIMEQHRESSHDRFNHVIWACFVSRVRNVDALISKSCGQPCLYERTNDRYFREKIGNVLAYECEVEVVLMLAVMPKLKIGLVSLIYV